MESGVYIDVKSLLDSIPMFQTAFGKTVHFTHQMDLSVLLTCTPLLLQYKIYTDMHVFLPQAQF